MIISNETGDILLKILGGILAFFTFRWIVKIFAGNDKKLDTDELKKATAYIIFVGAFIYMLIKEGQRPAGTEHIFSETWLFFVISALLTVLALEKIFDTFSKLLELLIRLKTKVPYNETSVTQGTTLITKDTTITATRTNSGVSGGSEAGQGDKEGD